MTYRMTRPNGRTVDFHCCDDPDEAKHRYQLTFGTWPNHEPQLVNHDPEEGS